jgi:hypothetical protein
MTSRPEVGNKLGKWSVVFAVMVSFLQLLEEDSIWKLSYRNTEVTFCNPTECRICYETICAIFTVSWFKRRLVIMLLLKSVAYLTAQNRKTSWRIFNLSFSKRQTVICFEMDDKFHWVWINDGLFNHISVVKSQQIIIIPWQDKYTPPRFMSLPIMLVKQEHGTHS